MTFSLKPPFTEEAARAKVQLAEDLWNTRTASINDVPIKADERTLPFTQGATS